MGHWGQIVPVILGPNQAHLLVSGRKHIYKTRLKPCFVNFSHSDFLKFKGVFPDCERPVPPKTWPLTIKWGIGHGAMGHWGQIVPVILCPNQAHLLVSGRKHIYKTGLKPMFCKSYSFGFY
jgi:hypothetical protein